MKKILSIALVVVMLFSCIVISTNAAEAVTSTGAYVNGGYVDRNGYSFGQSQEIEFDLWLANDDSGIQFWADSAVTRYTFAKTYVGANVAGGGSAYGEDDYAGIEWGDLGTTTTGGWHHFNLDLNVGGADKIYMDGELVWTGRTTANSYWSDRIILNAIGDGVVFDNFIINGMKWDFENGDSGIFGDNCELVTVVVEQPVIEEGVVSNAAYLNTGYADNLDYSIGSSQTWTFDLWLYDEASGIQFWADTATTRYTIAYNYVGMNAGGAGGGYDGTDDFAGIEWGGEAGLTVASWHTFTIEMNVDGADRIYMDGELVWTGRATANEYWSSGTLYNTMGNGVAIDNLTITGSNGNTYSWDFEDGDLGILNDGSLTEVVVKIGDDPIVLDCPHLATTEVVDLAPTCQAEGIMGIYCNNADCHVEGGRIGEYAIETVDHVWPDESACSYEDGAKVWYCTFGCGTTAVNSIPASEAYEGDLWYYYDFADANATQKIQGFFDAEGLVVENGVGHIPNGNDMSYHQNPHDSRSNTNWSVTFDFCVEDIYDTGDTASYGHKVYFWFGGSSGMAHEAGYDFDKGCFYIKPSSGNVYDAFESYVELELGAWNTLKFVYDCPGEDAYWDEGAINTCYFELNGEVVCAFDDEITAAFELPTSAKYIILRTFGVEAYIDNYAVGSADFAWIEAEELLYGDVNGDEAINVRDLLFIKKFLAGAITADDINVELADVNADGQISAKDVMALKALLVK